MPCSLPIPPPPSPPLDVSARISHHSFCTSAVTGPLSGRRRAAGQVGWLVGWQPRHWGNVSRHWGLTAPSRSAPNSNQHGCRYIGIRTRAPREVCGPCRPTCPQADLKFALSAPTRASTRNGISRRTQAQFVGSAKISPFLAGRRNPINKALLIFKSTYRIH